MSRWPTVLVSLVALSAAGLAAFILIPVQRTAPADALPPDWQPEPGAGEYAMRASDCYACHTADGGEAFAGGRPIESALGTIYSANITPDGATGIGGWSLDQFRAALIDGVSADGTHLYPAMPYENYRLLTERDIRAMYQYFTTEVPAVRNEVAEAALIFPFNQRWGIRALNWLTLRHEAGFTPKMGDPDLDRGQYLVEAPGHCAACHSPRTIYMGQDGIKADDEAFLTGGEIEGWEAPPLRGSGSALRDWDVNDLSEFLATGRNRHSTANGEMALVVEHSLQHLTEPDIHSISRFLRVLDGLPDETPAPFDASLPLSLPPSAPDGAGADTAALLTAAAPDMPLGARLYLDNCAACHFVSGKGSPGIFPALQGNSLVLSDEVTPFVSIILNGAEVPGTRLRPMPLVMQGYSTRLDDSEIAALASFIRSAWGNNASGISTETVATIRDELDADE